MRYDDIIIGAGHNGSDGRRLPRRGRRRVLVLERADHVGGAAVSARAFDGVDARLSRYSYLVSLLPRQVLTDLDLDLRLIRRRFSSYTPVPSDPDRGLLVDHGDAAATRAAFRALTGGDDAYAGWTDFYARMAGVAERSSRPSSNRCVRGRRARPRRVTPTLRCADDAPHRRAHRVGHRGRHAPRHHRHRRPHRHLRLARRDRSAPERLLPLPPHRAAPATGTCPSAAWVHSRTRLRQQRSRPERPSSPEPRSRRWTRPPARSRGPAVTQGAAALWPGNLVAGCAPTVLNRLLAASGATPVRHGVRRRGGPAQGQHAADPPPPACVTPPSTRRPPSPGPSTSTRATAKLEQTYAAARDGRIPELPPCEIYCHTLSDRSILGPDLAATVRRH